MGTTLKCQVFYKEPFWRDSNGYSYDGYVGGANYPILWVMDNSGTGPEGPFVLMTFTRAYTKQFARHKAMARWVFPLWLYVAVTGPACYLMLRPYYP